MDAAKAFRVHLLDMGRVSYGDCVLVEVGGKRILIDGGHPGDAFKNARIAKQLGTLLNESQPHSIDLLVVTHCHGDHIGCLEDLIVDGVIGVKNALVADPELGFPAKRDTDEPALSRDGERILRALEEEALTSLPDAEIARVLDGVAIYREDYERLLTALSDAGAEVVFYGRDGLGPEEATEWLAPLFTDVGVYVPGPSIAMLETCQDRIATYVKKKRHDLADFESRKRVDSATDRVALYRAVADPARRTDSGDLFDGDVDSPGPAKNDQSIVLVIEANGHRVLLGADMQFAQPEITGLGPSMDALLQETAQWAPFSFVKLSHHGSYNGFDQDVLDAWQGTKNFGVSTGVAKTPHPAGTVLDVLSQHADELRWARTDRNGRITVSLPANGPTTMKKQRGVFNDDRRNAAYDAAEETLEAASEFPQEQVVSGGAPTRDTVEVIARVPHRRTRVQVTIEVEPAEDGAGRSGLQVEDHRRRSARLLGERRPSISPGEKKLGGGRELPQLLFVLPEEKRFARRVGEDQTSAVRRIIEDAKQPVVRLGSSPEDFESCRSEVLAAVAKEQPKGVVLIGGYDLIPSEHLDLLEAATRAELPAPGSRSSDPDDWLIWSDDAYGDLDNNGFPELPVSRIPDGQRADVVINALAAGDRRELKTRGGVRNVARPYADEILQRLVGGKGDLLISAPTRPQDVPADVCGCDHVYLVLHGRYDELHVFTGDTDRESGEPGGEAFACSNISDVAAGNVVFCACCWGALPVARPAVKWRPGLPLASLTPAESIAVSFLRYGARAFVGTTGVHYPPDPTDTVANSGGPFHLAFWSHLLGHNGRQPQAPALALLRAKEAYRDGRPYFSAGDPEADRSRLDDAIEIKHTFQFTCLGLGW
ncbi:MAG TPA: MBL fold metallo-hydrolase [Thermoanaerobaculia bacterium]|nr:MBL fold metallo-hydrolase [Thermoanaerobaculia bacterium]